MPVYPAGFSGRDAWRSAASRLRLPDQLLQRPPGALPAALFAAALSMGGLALIPFFLATLRDFQVLPARPGLEARL